jgi:hypothetical protein
MKYQKEKHYDFISKGFNCIFLIQENFENEIKEFDTWYRNCYSEYSKLIESKSSNVAEFIASKEEVEYISEELIEEIRSKVMHSDFRSICNYTYETLNDSNKSQSVIGDRIFEKRDEYQLLLSNGDSRVGKWKFVPFLTFLEKEIENKALLKDNKLLIFEIAHRFYHLIFINRIGIVNYSEFIIENKNKFYDSFLNIIFSKSIEFLENEGISETETVFFNFNRNRNGRECGYHIKGFENGVFNQIGQKISEKINGYDELRILILRGNQVIYFNINGGGEALSITHLKRQIKFIKTNSNLVSIFFQGNHLPIEMFLDSSKDAVDIKNKLLS